MRGLWIGCKILSYQNRFVFLKINQIVIGICLFSFLNRELTTSQLNISMPQTSRMGLRLLRLREVMRKKGLSALIIPSEDAHQSEYIARRDESRAYITGFTGSAGFAVVTLANLNENSELLGKAALWTDGRYFLQAENQLDLEHWELMRAGTPGVPKREEWLSRIISQESTVGIDARLLSLETLGRIRDGLEENNGPRLELVTESLINKIWESDTDNPRPQVELLPVSKLDLKFCGELATSKIAKISETIRDLGHYAHLVTALDEIAWILNLRGQDIECNPVFFAFLLIRHDASCVLYSEEISVSAVKDSLLKEIPNLSIKPYESIYSDLSLQSGDIYSEILSSGKKLSVGLATCNTALVKDLMTKETRPGKYAHLATLALTPIQLAKAVKNQVEIEGFKNCHVRDGAALVKYFAWVKKYLEDDSNMLDEWEGAELLEKYRKQGEHFRGLSFPTISGSGSNGAVIHYKPEAGKAAQITRHDLYLCDSGAQYLDGTTDVTRTVHFGNPSQEIKNAFTLVLLGHIALAQAVFPQGTTGHQLDSLARQFLWKAHMDFRHGTGHGVGHYLNVHEMPPTISFRSSTNDQALRPGMIVTNEPGFYKEGSFGIRIENVMLVSSHSSSDDHTSVILTSNQNSEEEFMCFKTLTMAPIQKSLIEMSLLSTSDIEWINTYHAEVRAKLQPLLENDPLALEYLLSETSSL